MSLQLPLDMRLPPRATLAEFVAGANGQALQALQELARGDRPGQLFLSGPPASGKSHLLMAATAEAAERGLRSVYLPLAELTGLSPEAIEGLAGSALLALDDIHCIAGKGEWERAVFLLYEQARAEGTSLLLAAPCGPAALQLALPDLRSRLAWGESYRLEPLDDAGREALLLRQARARGLRMHPRAAAWMVSHCSRDPRHLLELLSRLDTLSLASGRRLTLSFVREQLRSAE